MLNPLLFLGESSLCVLAIKGSPSSSDCLNSERLSDWESIGLIIGGRDHNWLCQDIRCQGLLLLDAHSALGMINFAVLD